jgi:colanic acid biosynthesis glycosyl transferase WcaI
MRVLIFTQFFSPEIGATQARLQTIAAALAQHDHDVTVICEVPNHPQGVIHPGYRGRPLVRRRRDGFGVLHVWVKTSPTKTRLSRLGFYASYAAMATLVGCAQRKPDVVLASSPPLPVAAAAAAVAARHRVPWVFDVRDLWPEAAVALGELSPGRALKLAERLADTLYENAVAVTSVTEPFCRAISAKVSAPEKVHHVPNGTTRFWLEGADLEPDRAHLGLPVGRFIWTFAGNIGAAQGLEAAIDAAAILESEPFELHILGDGPAKAELEARAAENRASATRFTPQVTHDVALRYLRASDALLVSLAQDPALRLFVPSKLYDFCAVGRPVIVAAAGEPTRIADDTGAALTVSPGDPEALAMALRRLRGDLEFCERLSATGRRFAAKNLRETHMRKLEEVLLNSSSPALGSQRRDR